MCSVVLIMVEVARACPQMTQTLTFIAACGSWIRQCARLIQILTYKADTIKGIKKLYMISDWGMNAHKQSSEAWYKNYYDVQSVK
jgi:hypothetical protein